MKLLCTLLLGLVVVVGCKKASPPTTTGSPATDEDLHLPKIETRADSVAMAAYQASGGPRAWTRLRYVRFDFGVETESTKRVFRRHLWDRFDGQYRVEWERGPDSSFVILLNVQDRNGQAYINGEPVDESRREGLVARGYEAFINDTYWLLAPVKLLDPGVIRTFVPDSSDAITDVITTTYADVGLTPDDQFWFWVDHETGKVTRWAFQLQGEKDKPPTNFVWGDFKQFETEGGTVKLIPRKSGPTRALMTDHIAVPADVADGAFTEPEAQLLTDAWTTGTK